jgi:geranylgeranyl pyrophosphate synthase
MAEGVYNLPVLRAFAGARGGALRELLGGPLDADGQARALAIVREGDGVAEAVTEARAYVDRAVDDLSRLPPTAAGKALAAATYHLLAGVER